MRDPGGAPQQNFFEFGYENIFKVLKILSWEIKQARKLQDAQAEELISLQANKLISW